MDPQQIALRKFTTGQLARGFSLIEVLIAFAIVVVVTSITAPSFIRAVDGARFNAASRDIFNALRSARDLAQRNQGESTLTIDTAALTYLLDGHEHVLNVPQGATLGLVTSDDELVNGVAARIRFFSDGSSTGGRVTLATESRSLSIDVDWLTGQVRFMQ
jgi:general secretion pathway protein H